MKADNFGNEYQIGPLLPRRKTTLPGHKTMKGRFILLLCCNARDDFKVKILLVFYNDNSQVFKRNNVIKSKFSVS